MLHRSHHGNNNAASFTAFPVLNLNYPSAFFLFKIKINSWIWARHPSHGWCLLPSTPFCFHCPIFSYSHVMKHQIRTQEQRRLQSESPFLWKQMNNTFLVLTRFIKTWRSLVFKIINYWSSMRVCKLGQKVSYSCFHTCSSLLLQTLSQIPLTFASRKVVVFPVLS